MKFSGKNLETVGVALLLLHKSLCEQIEGCPDPQTFAEELQGLKTEANRLLGLINQIKGELQSIGRPVEVPVAEEGKPEMPIIYIPPGVRRH